MNYISQRRRSTGFTIVELMIVVAIIALIASVAVPNWLRARKRAQAGRILDDLRSLDHAMQLYAIENNKVGSEPVAPGDMALFKTYIKTGVALEAALPNDMFGNPFTMTTLEGGPKLSKDSYDALSDTVPLQFWEPYYP